jgi:urease accessory protein
MHSAWLVDDTDAVLRWSNQWRAMRTTRELREEDRQLGLSLRRLLTRQGVTKADSWLGHLRATLGSAFSLASVVWDIDAPAMAVTYCFAWSEAQVGAASRLVPLGQTEAQRILAVLLDRATQGLERSLRLHNDDIASSAPGQSLHSTWHETLYTRLFRS